MLTSTVFLLGLLQGSASFPQNFDSAYRLPRSIIPIRYQMNIEFNEQRYCNWHKGVVKIDFFCVQETSTLTLHFHDLSYLGQSLNCKTQSNLTLTNPRLDPLRQIITFDFGPEPGYTLKPGETCTATLSNKWRRQGSPILGVYGGSKDEFHLATLFSKTGARLLFPCFDEPAFKAVFQLNMALESAFSKQVRVTHNTPLVRKKKKGLKEVWEFEETPIMSSYLLAIVISNNTVPRVDYVRVNPPRIETIGMRDQEDLYKAAHVIGAANDLFAEMFQFANPVKKISYISENPSDGSAMENWGLIIGSFNHAVHEVIHSWFGNLVTNDFWDDIWLNEGLTHFYTGIAFGIMPPEENFTTDATYFHRNLWLQAMRLGQIRNWSLSGEHFIARDAYFYYAVGPAILRMVEGLLGPENMLMASRRYIKAFAYRTAKTSDYLAILDQVSSEMRIPGWIPGRALSFSDFLHNWIFNRRFPIVNIDLINDNYVLTQTCVRDESASEDSCPKDWTIPIWYRHSSSPNISGHIWLLPGQELKIPVPSEGVIIWDPEIRSYFLIRKTFEDAEFLANETSVNISSRISDLLHSVSFGDDEFHSKKVESLLERISETDSEDLWTAGGLAISQKSFYSAKSKKELIRKLFSHIDCNSVDNDKRKIELANAVIARHYLPYKGPCDLPNE